MTQKIKKFSHKTIEALEYYVYGLKDPVSKKYFYIGKGKGNRVFSHVNQSVRRGMLDPKFDVIDALKALGGPEIDIIRHGLKENEALLLESALIDTLGVDQLVNKVRGVDSDKFGLMSPVAISQQYRGVPFRSNVKAICFKINRGWKKDITEDDLYEAVRGNWRLNLQRSKSANFAMGVYDGVIRAIYNIEGWEVSPGRDPIRYKFTGQPALNMTKYLGCTVTHLASHRVRGPLFYINC
jgi:hypothetical protein